MAARKVLLTWYALNQAPRNHFEQVLCALRPIVRPPPECSGVEYWWRVQGAPTGYPFHYDHDEAKAHLVTPLLSSIFYLSDVGGPTLIFDVAPYEGKSPTAGVGVVPEFSQFAVFSGRLFHCVQPGSAGRWPRVAFFANWWAQKPQGAQPTPDPSTQRASPLAPRLPRANHPRAGRADGFRPSDLLSPAEWLTAIRSAEGPRSRR